MDAMSILSDLSNDAAALAAGVSPRVVAVEGSNGRSSSGFIWRTGLVVTAEEALEGEDEVTVHFGNGASTKATLAGRDPSTDVALLRAETPEFGEWATADAVQPASFALVAGRGETSAIATLTSVGEVGPAWRSMRGGRIDANIVLALRLSSRTEGAAVVTPDGKLIGMAVSSPGRSPRSTKRAMCQGAGSASCCTRWAAGRAPSCSASKTAARRPLPACWWAM
jgi:S1-C subfamily serine protease